MVYRRRFKGRRRFRGRRRFSRRKSGGLKRWVRKKLDAAVEDKKCVYDITATFGSVSTAGQGFSIGGCMQTVNAIQGGHVGRKVRIKSLEIKGILSGGQNGTALDEAYNVVRLCVVSARGTSTTTPPAFLLGAGLNAPFQHDITNSASLSKVYMDRYIPMVSNGTERAAGDGLNPHLRFVHYYKRWRNGFPIIYLSDTTATKRDIWIWMLTDSAAVPNPGFVNGWIKVIYEDA